MANPEPTPASLTVNGPEIAANARKILLEPNELKTIHVQSLFQLASGTRGVLQIAHARGRGVVTQIINEGPDLAVGGFKNPTFEGGRAYSFPVRLGPGLSTHLRIFNPNESAVDAAVFLYFDDQRFTYPLTALEAGEWIEIDLGELQEERTEDAIGQRIPAGSIAGQAKVILRSRDAPKRLVAKGLIEDRATGKTLALESCLTCPPVVTSVSASPSSIRDFAVQRFPVHLFVTFSDGSFSILAPTFMVTTNSTVASPLGSSVELLGPGNATVTAAFRDCAVWQLDQLDFCSYDQPCVECSCFTESTWTDSIPVTGYRVRVLSADVTTDRIRVRLEPSGVSGLMNLELTSAAGNHQIRQETRAGGIHNETFNIPALPARQFQQARATWTVGGASGSHGINYGIRVLGDYRNTCYITASENDFGGVQVAVSTTPGPNACIWNDLNFRRGFLEALNTNGSGVDATGSSMQPEAICGNPPTVYCGGIPHRCVGYRRPTQIRTACLNPVVVDTTVAAQPGHPHLRCGDQIYIDGIGTRTVQDTGDLQEAQIDNYRGIGNAVCANWANLNRKTIRLP